MPIDRQTPPSPFSLHSFFPFSLFPISISRLFTYLFSPFDPILIDYHIVSKIFSNRTSPFFPRSLRTLVCHEHLTRSVSNEINLAGGKGGVKLAPSNHVPLFPRNKLLPEFQTLTPSSINGTISRKCWGKDRWLSWKF